MAFFQLPALPERVLLAGGGRALRDLLVRTGLPAEHADRYTARMREPGALTAALGWYRSVAASRGRGPGRVAVPTTYLWGRHDPFFARGAARRTGDFVRGPYREEELDAGHWLPETRPREVADAVLRRAGSGPG
jgi:pimeloyl-ACP methyl ester carboxylesterase